MASKVIIVTGASKGIGLAISRTLLNNGHKVVLAARSAEQLEQLKSEFPGQVEYLTGDLSDFSVAPKLASLAVQAFGGLNGVVVNHGVLIPMTRLEDASVDEWRRLYDVNVFSGLVLAKAVIPELRKAKGCIVWVSSGAATNAYTSWGAYGSSKAAANSLSDHVAVEEPDITSVSISPGRVDTEMQKVLREEGRTVMKAAEHASFVAAFESGLLFKPEQPGGVIARLVVNPQSSLSGKFLKFQAPELAAYQE